jgi:hypothetical protein
LYLEELRKQDPGGFTDSLQVSGALRKNKKSGGALIFPWRLGGKKITPTAREDVTGL